MYHRGSSVLAQTTWVACQAEDDNWNGVIASGGLIKPVRMSAIVPPEMLFGAGMNQREAGTSEV